MATTYAQLQTEVGRRLGDPDALTFTSDDVKDMIQAAWAEVSRCAPERFQENLTPTDGASEYLLRSDKFDAPVPELEINRIEIWDVSGTHPKAWRKIEAQAAHPSGLTYSQAGWFLWDGILYIPDRWIDMIDPDKHIIRVWGYSPWSPVVNDADVLPFGEAIHQAVLAVCAIEGLRRLISNRTLFAQWQTRSNNTDVTSAALANDLNIALADWARKYRQIFVLREAPG